jgi:hypothetical protein
MTDRTKKTDYRHVLVKGDSQGLITDDSQGLIIEIDRA